MSGTAARLLIPFAAFMFSACGTDQTTEPGPGSESRAIPPTGGSVSASDGQGVHMAITFPSGAVLDTTKVTLRALEPPSGTVARFEVEPAGLALLAPAEIVVQVPAGVQINPNMVLRFSGETEVEVPGVVDVGTRTVRASVYQFGFDAPVPTAPKRTGRTARSVSGMPLITIDLIEFDCQQARDALSEAILNAEAWDTAFPYNLAMPLILKYRAAALVCGSADSVGVAAEQLKQLACLNVVSADTEAGTSESVDIGTFQKNVQALLSAEGLAQETGAECHVLDASYESEFGEYIDAYTARINDPSFVASFPTWDALWREIRNCTDLLANARLLGLDATEQKIETELMPALFARLREVARDACEEDGNTSLLLDILSGGDLLRHPLGVGRSMPPYTGLSAEDLYGEVHRCGSRLSFTSTGSAGEHVDDLLVGGVITTGAIAATADGHIDIEDDLASINCGRGVFAGDVVNVAAVIPGVVSVPLGVLDGNRTISMASVQGALPGDTLTAFDLVFTREREQCDLPATGSPTIELYRVTVQVAEDRFAAYRHEYVGTFRNAWGDGRCSSECPVIVRFRININGIPDHWEVEDADMSNRCLNDDCLTFSTLGFIIEPLQSEFRFRFDKGGGTGTFSGDSLTITGTWDAGSVETITIKAKRVAGSPHSNRSTKALRRTEQISQGSAVPGLTRFAEALRREAPRPQLAR